MTESSEEGTPYLAIGNRELDRNPEVRAGDAVRCANCGNPHELRGGESVNAAGEVVGMSPLLFYHCPENDGDYLGGLNGHLLNGLERVDGEANL